MLDLTVIILTFNEERHIARAIASVTPVAREIIVVDSYSTDGTPEIAKALGARVSQHPFTNYARQFQWALDNCVVNTAWILRLDADEIMEPDLQAEMLRALPHLPADTVGLYLDCKHIFMDRWIRHGGRYPLRLLRLWRTGYGRIEQRWMDEHIIVTGGSTAVLKGGLVDHNLNGLSFFTAKHNSYATREALEVLNQRYRLFPEDGALLSSARRSQAGWKRFVKEHIYNKMPFAVGSLSYFIYRFLFQRGFMDGRPGLIYHILQGFWYRFLVEAKRVEFELAIRHCSANSERVQALRQITGLDISESA